MSAAEIEDAAARWLLRQEEGDWAEPDQAALDDWLDASAAHQAAYWRLEQGWRKADRLAAMRRPQGQDAYPHPRFSRWRRPVAIGASLAAALAAVAVLVVGVTPRPTYTTALGGRATVPLPDGTHVELNTNTRLRSEVTSKARAVWLDRGEAYFEVAHDASRPFTIYAGPRKVTVIGTKFSVRREGDHVQVSVVEGRVRVDTLDAPKPIAPRFLTRGGIVIAQGASTMAPPPSLQRVSSELSWRQGMLSFEQTPLSHVADEFNRYNRKKMVITDAAVGATRIGGIFQAENVDGFVELLQQGYGLKVENSEDEVKISN